MISSRATDMRNLDSISRQDMIARLLEYRDCPPIDFRSEWLHEQPTAQLRLLLLAADLYWTLKQRRRQTRASLRRPADAAN
jgi:hypothetical protein